MICTGGGGGGGANVSLMWCWKASRHVRCGGPGLCALAVSGFCLCDPGKAGGVGQQEVIYGEHRKALF